MQEISLSIAAMLQDQVQKNTPSHNKSGQTEQDSVMMVKAVCLLILDTEVIHQHMYHQQPKILVWAIGEMEVELLLGGVEMTLQPQQHNGNSH